MGQSYDYIIIGAGSAGCVLAKRLSENPKNCVLLLEAGGPDNNLNIHVPGAYLKVHKSKEDWGFWTEEQASVLNRKIYCYPVVSILFWNPSNVNYVHNCISCIHNSYITVCSLPSK